MALNPESSSGQSEDEKKKFNQAIFNALTGNSINTPEPTQTPSAEQGEEPEILRGLIGDAPIIPLGVDPIDRTVYVNADKLPQGEKLVQQAEAPPPEQNLSTGPTAPPAEDASEKAPQAVIESEPLAIFGQLPEVPKKQPARPEATGTKLNEKMEYVPLGELMNKLVNLGGRAYDILPAELSKSVFESVSFNSPTAEWNEAMKAKKEAARLMAEWIEKHSAGPEKPVKTETVPTSAEPVEKPKPAEKKDKIEPVAAGVQAENPIKTEQEKKLILEEGLLKSFGNFIYLIKYQEGSNVISITDEKKAQIIYEQINGRFQTLTGEDFNKRMKEEAIKEAESQGHEIRTKEEYFSPEHTTKIREREQHNAWSVGIQTAWDKLSKTEREKWNIASSQDEKTKDKPDGGARQFARQLERDRRALEGKGYVLSRDVYFKLFQEGFDPRTIKIKGLFNKKIEIRKDSEIEKFSMEEFEAQEKERQRVFDEDLDKKVADKMNKGYVEAQSRWVKRKLKKAGDIVLDVTKDFQETISPEEGRKLITERVRPEIKPEMLTPEQEEVKLKQEEQNAREEYDRKLAKLIKIKDKIVQGLKDSGLTDSQLEGLTRYINGETSSKRLLKDISIETQRLLKDFIDERVKVDKEKNDKLNRINKTRIIRLREVVRQEVAELSAA